MVIPILSGGLKLASGFGVNTIVGSVIRPHIPATIGPIRSACVEIGILGISGVVSDSVNNYIDKTIKEAAEFIVENDLDKLFIKPEDKNE